MNVLTSDWILNSNNKYEATVTVLGINSDDKPFCDLDYSQTITDAMKIESNKIETIQSLDNAIKLIASAQPTTNLPLNIIVLRVYDGTTDFATRTYVDNKIGDIDAILATVVDGGEA